MSAVRYLGLFPSETCPFLSPVFGKKFTTVIQKAVPSFWRVKKWRFECSVGMQDRDGIGYSYSFLKNLDVTEQQVDPDGRLAFVGNENINSEMDMVCAARSTHMWGIANTNGDPVDAEADVRIGSRPKVDILLNDSYPLSSRWDNYPLEFTGVDGYGAYEANWGVIVVTFLNQTFNLPMIGRAVGPLPCGSSTGNIEFGDICFRVNGDPFELLIDTNAHRVNSVSGTLTATEYWPYDPNDGLGPIYDTATGKQLRPFPN